MLTKLLALLDEGRAYSRQELAEKLGVNVETVAAQMEYLERLQLLRRVNMNGGCAQGCKGCTAGCDKNPVMPVAMWEKVPR